jgi:predicted nucleotidyltransferase
VDVPPESSGAVRAALDALLAADCVKARDVAAVWLFGSRARGSDTEGSDVDLAVLASPALGLERARLMELVARAARCEVDVVDLAEAPPALAWEVVTTGRLLVERDERAVEAFVRNARFAAEDAAQRDRMVLLAQVGRVGGRTR